MNFRVVHPTKLGRRAQERERASLLCVCCFTFLFYFLSKNEALYKREKNKNNRRESSSMAATSAAGKKEAQPKTHGIELIHKVVQVNKCVPMPVQIHRLL